VKDHAMIRILVVDDHDVVRTGFRSLLETYPNFELVGEAVEGNEAITIATETRPDVVVLDYYLPLINGLDVTRELRSRLPGTEVLIFTMHYSEQFAQDVLSAGARGYLLKSDATRDLIPAIKAVAAHRPYFTDRAADTLMSQLRVTQHRHCSKLTNREREVVVMVADGYSSREIAEALGIHLPTVETHRASAIHKLQLSSSASSAGLVRYAVRNKLIEA
jgi:DNA-binding NarL/FixJ family response regulator